MKPDIMPMVDLEDILNLDISKLRQEKLTEHRNQSKNEHREHRVSFGLIPQTPRSVTIDFLERHYHNNGKFPNIKSIDENLLRLGYRKDVPHTREEWLTFLSDPEFEEILINRGLPVYDSNPNRIDLNFSLAVTLICDISDKRSLAAKLKDAGLTTRQWTGFLKRKSHYDYFEHRLNQVWDNEVEQKARISLMKSVESGDLTAIKYFHEYTDRYRPQDQQILNLQIIVSGLLEILAKHLTKEALIAVAAELEQTGLLSVSQRGPVGELNVG